MKIMSKNPNGSTSNEMLLITHSTHTQSGVKLFSYFPKKTSVNLKFQVFV